MNVQSQNRKSLYRSFESINLSIYLNQNQAALDEHQEHNL